MNTIETVTTILICGGSCVIVLTDPQRVGIAVIIKAVNDDRTIVIILMTHTMYKHDRLRIVMMIVVAMTIPSGIV